MEIEIDYTKSAQDNANDYYSRAKKLQQKKEGAKRAVEELKKRLEKAMEESEQEEKPEERKAIRKEEKKWYEKFHWFIASNGMLVIGGRDAHQNEEVNAKYFDERDIFFHANIFGADVVVLKEGKDAPHEVKEEAAQFAACHSSAWKDGLHAIDVYAMRREQVSKSQAKGTLGTGAFLLTGERDWYRGMSLGLVMFTREGGLNCVPMATFYKIKEGEQIPRFVKIEIGKEKKSDAAKKIAKALEYDDIDVIMQQLPAGSFKVTSSN
ncbi:MAG: NFACT RNA binding domain-containing protein [Candidatus Micrarchaeales archaeon]|nr:NFACT RNA binding domain-containing protein [Candidatus Micrarchaeales archaeon]